MQDYYVSKNAQANGDHEVHEFGCPWLPRPENRIYLGRRYPCSSVVMNAKGGKFPSVVWYRDGETIFEARLTNRVSGEYHGYALRSGQTVTGLH